MLKGHCPLEKTDQSVSKSFNNKILKPLFHLLVQDYLASGYSGRHMNKILFNLVKQMKR